MTTTKLLIGLILLFSSGHFARGPSDFQLWLNSFRLNSDNENKRPIGNKINSTFVQWIEKGRSIEGVERKLFDAIANTGLSWSHRQKSAVAIAHLGSQISSRRVQQFLSECDLGNHPKLLCQLYLVIGQLDDCSALQFLVSEYYSVKNESVRAAIIEAIASLDSATTTVWNVSENVSLVRLEVSNGSSCVLQVLRSLKLKASSSFLSDVLEAAMEKVRGKSTPSELDEKSDR